MNACKKLGIADDELENSKKKKYTTFLLLVKQCFIVDTGCSYDCSYLNEFVIVSIRNQLINTVLNVEHKTGDTNS